MDENDARDALTHESAQCNSHAHGGCPEEPDDAAGEFGHVPGANETEGVSA